MKIGVVGLGLIGGSIFKKLIAENFDVIGVSRSQKGEKIFQDYEVLKDREIIFVCSAMNKTLEILDELENYLNPKTIVTDVCSLKEFVCNKKRPYRFIPSHPMAGTEHQGFKHSFAELFDGAKWAITPYLESGVPESFTKIIQKLGAMPVITTPQEHDAAVAMISHMPMVIAQALFSAASENQLAMELAASGFRDMTRLAMSNTEMAEDMILMNSKNIEHAILQLYKSVGDLTSSNYKDKIEKIKHAREKMFVK